MNNLEELPEDYRKVPGQLASMEMSGSLEMMRAMLTTEYVGLWAALKRAKYQALQAQGFSPSEALHLLD